jgi:hypothetical protein
MGEDGYVSIARQIMELAAAYRRGIEAIIALCPNLS